MILNATKIGNDTVLDCSEYNGNFLDSKILKKLIRSTGFFSPLTLWLKGPEIVSETEECLG